jgi:hypothetical protein
MIKLLGKIKDRVIRLTGKMDQYQEAIAFAEAGDQEHARRLLHKEEVAERSSKLLVMGRESSFSREVIDYALEMAERMSYEIVALNTAPLSCDTFKIFPSSQKKLCHDFKTLSEENVEEFKSRASRIGIPFVHVIKFSETDNALDEMKREYHDIEFVISEAEEEQVVNRVEEGERARKEIFVYSMV